MTGYKLADPAKVLEEVKLHNKVAMMYAEVYTYMMETLKNFHGKVVNRRIETALKKDPRLSKFIITYEIVARMYHINFWAQELGYEHRHHMFLGYVGQNDTLDIDNIRENNKGFLNCRIIDVSTVVDKVRKWNELVTAIENFTKENGPGEDISYLLRR